ncbi:MAG: TlpA family protein disulfide reductase [Acidimicrobiales bacterium]
MEVVDLTSGDTVDLHSLAVAGKPTLLWFWAPHCTFCMREAPELLAFAAEHGDAVHILGIGARDDLDLAFGFVDRTDTDTLAMLWDPSGETWIHYGVTNQPTVVVLAPDGEVRGTWFRDVDEDGILAAAGLT